jgi:hypothetical protein
MRVMTNKCCVPFILATRIGELWPLVKTTAFLVLGQLKKKYIQAI